MCNPPSCINLESKIRSNITSGMFSSDPVGNCRGLLASPDVTALSAGDSRRSLPRFTGVDLAANQKLVDVLVSVAKQEGVTPAQLVLAWVLRRVLM